MRVLVSAADSFIGKAVVRRYASSEDEELQLVGSTRSGRLLKGLKEAVEVCRGMPDPLGRFLSSLSEWFTIGGHLEIVY